MKVVMPSLHLGPDSGPPLGELEERVQSAATRRGPFVRWYLGRRHSGLPSAPWGSLIPDTMLGTGAGGSLLSRGP